MNAAAVSIEWRRYATWCAHLYINGVQACSTRHDWGTKNHTSDPKTLPASELTAEGRPYGKICQRCERVHREMRR